MRTMQKVRLVLGAVLLAGAGGAPVTAVDEQAGDMPDLVPEQALFWMACYLTFQSYGGSAEGDWWFDEGERVTDPDIYRTLGGTPRSFLTEHEADAHAAELAAKLVLLNQDRPPKHASTTRGTYEVHVLQAASLPVAFPAARPRYE